MSSPSPFSFVRIPKDSSLPVEIVDGDGSGGLENDYLVNTAKKTFADEQKAKGGDTGLSDDAFDKLTPPQRKELAGQIREQFGKNAPGNGMKDVDDEIVLAMYKSSMSDTANNSCDIVALTVPTAGNGFKAVSMYTNNAAGEAEADLNGRATGLLAGCGHAARPVYGDVFVGRAHDNEASDVWSRADFSVEDASPDSDWCGVARKAGGGGGRGGGGAPSLTGTMGKAFSQAMGGAPQTPVGTLMDGQEVEEKDEGYSWSQTKEEVEIKLSVAPGTKAKYVKVKFQRNTIKVTVAGQTLVQGDLGGQIVVDESTYTIQDDNSGGRELCISLGKDQVNTAWTEAVKKLPAR